jgi:hypothetical protein
MNHQNEAPLNCHFIPPGDGEDVQDTKKQELQSDNRNPEAKSFSTRQKKKSNYEAISDAAHSFQQTSQIALEVGCSAVWHEATAVRSHLEHLDLKRKWQYVESDHLVIDSAKRRRLNDGSRASDVITIASYPSPSHTPKSGNNSSSDGASLFQAYLRQSEQMSAWRRAVRMKRMSIMLRDMEMLQHLLLNELYQCAADAVDDEYTGI